MSEKLPMTVLVSATESKRYLTSMQISDEATILGFGAEDPEARI